MSEENSQLHNNEPLFFSKVSSIFSNIKIYLTDSRFLLVDTEKKAREAISFLQDAIDDLKQAIADNLEEQHKAGDWIDITETPPPINESVFILDTSGKVKKGYWLDDGRQITTYPLKGSLMLYVNTHWKPINKQIH